MKRFFSILPLIAVMMGALAWTASCSKEAPELSDMIQVAPQTPAADSEEGQDNPSGQEPETPEQPVEKPSKYKPEELITVTFSAEAAEVTKTTLGESGSGAGGTGRAISWVLGDKVMFVWGDDEEDKSEGTVIVVSEDGKRATFEVERVYEGAKAIYAVYPSAAFSSFVKGAEYDTDGSGTVKVSVGAMADGSRADGSFGQADVCIARSSLESGKMKFKHLVAFVAVTTPPAADAVRLDAGLVTAGGILPVQATVGADGFTGDVTNPGAAGMEEVQTTLTVNAQGPSATTYIPVVKGLSFADGITFSYLDKSDQVIGQATLRHATQTASLGAVFTLPVSLNKKFSKDYYVTADADGTGDGSSWAKAWNYAQMAAYTGDTKVYESDVTVSAPVNIHIAAGTYYPTTQLIFRHKWTDDGEKTNRPLNIIGGYPASPDDSDVPDPDTYATLFDVSTSTYLTGPAVQVQSRGVVNVYGIRIANRSTTSTNCTAFAVWSNYSGLVLHCRVRKCRFYDNANTAVAAAVKVNATDGGAPDVVFEDCLFKDNEAGAGSALNCENVAGGHVLLKGCTFTGNHCIRYSSTYDQSSGGAVKISKTSATFENCTFDRNYLASTAYGNGGAVWLSDESATLGDYTVTFNDCSFTGNYTTNALSKGGAVFVQRYKKAIFNRCEFKENTVADASTALGGAMLIGCKTHTGQNHPGDNVDVELNNCIFDDNRVPNDSGTLRDAGGAVYLYQPASKTVSLSITGGEFKNHDLVDGEGGAIFAESGALTVSGCNLHDNHSTGSGYPKGTALQIKTATVTLSNNTTIADNTSSGCGIVTMTGAGSLTMTDCTLSGNSTTAGSGSALRVTPNGATLALTRVTFSGNSASSSGTVAIFKNTSGTFTGCRFLNNQSGKYAGAVYVGGEEGTPTQTFTGCVFTGNHSGSDGGAIYVGNAGNQAKKSDGTAATTLAETASYDSCEAGLIVDGCTFSGNYATNGAGGAIRLATSGKVTAGVSNVRILNSAFTGNETKTSNWYNSGGAIAVSYGQAGESVSAGVVSNPVKLYADVTGCTFTDNKTAVENSYDRAYGGAIAVIYGTILEKNDAGGKGVKADSYTCLRINQCNFIHNYASQGGAIGLYSVTREGSDDSEIYISNSLFYRNYIKNRAGSIIQRRGGGLHINNSTFHNAWAENGTHCAYFNIQYGGYLTVANSSIIGVPQRAEGTEDTDAGEALIRFDGISYPERYHFINSIICSTNANDSKPAFTGYNSTVTLVNTHPTTSGRGFFSTKASPAATIGTTNFSWTLPGSDTGEAVMTAYATSDYFGDIQWVCNASAPAYNNSGWAWNGVLGEGMGSKSTLSAVNTALDNSDPDFYAWLVSIGDVSADHNSGKDQFGANRNSPTTPGAIDCSLSSNAKNLSRETVTLTD